MRRYHKELFIIGFLIFVLVTMLTLFGGGITKTNQRILPDGRIIYTVKGHDYVKYNTKINLIHNHYENCSNPEHRKGN